MAGPEAPLSSQHLGAVVGPAASGNDDINAIYIHRVRPMFDCIDELRGVGIEKDISIPQIAVMGDQSSGKSSVLEMMSGIPFPRGTGLVTRCATELRMKRSTDPAKPWRARVSLSSGWQKPQPDAAGEVSSVEEIGSKIIDLTESLLAARGAGTTFEAEHSIVVELESRDAPDLTLIDLPGIVRTATEGQPQSVIQDVDTLLERYLSQTRTVILAVIPSNADIATIDIIERAAKADPDGTRTIGVLTKCDLIGEGEHARVIETLTNTLKPLTLGYVAVKNKSAKENDDGMTLAEAKSREISWFKGHESFRHVIDSSPELFGIRNLSEKLTEILQRCIKDSLPDMLREVDAAITNTQVELEELPEGFPSDFEGKKMKYISIVQNITSDLRLSISGNYVSDALLQKPELRIIANVKVIRPKSGPYDSFCRALIIGEAASIDSIKNKAQEFRGRELPGIPKFEVICSFVREDVNSWMPKVARLMHGVLEEVKSCGEGIIDHHLSCAKAISVKLCAILTRVLEGRIRDRCPKQIKKLLDNEKHPSTVNRHFLEFNNMIKMQHFTAMLDEALPSHSNLHTTNAKNIRTQLRDSFKATLPGSENFEHHEAEEIQAMLIAYKQLSVARFIDNALQLADSALMQGVDEQFFFECMCIGDENIRAIEDDALVCRKRNTLTQKLERLAAAKTMLLAGMSLV